MPEFASGPVPMTAAEAEHDRAMRAAARDAEFRRQALYMEPPPEGGSTSAGR